MSASAEGNNTDNTVPPVQSKYTAWADLQSDGKTLANQFIWNSAILYPCYMMDLDRYVFSERDGDVMSALIFAGVVAGVTEAQKLIRRTLTQAGVQQSITHPFGLPF